MIIFDHLYYLMRLLYFIKINFAFIKFIHLGQNTNPIVIDSDTEREELKGGMIHNSNGKLSKYMFL